MGTGSDEEFDSFMRGRWPAMVRLGYALNCSVGTVKSQASRALATLRQSAELVDGGSQ